MLSRLFVISRNSTFIYKDKPVKIRQVSEELGVQYVLEGSVMKSEDQVRVTVQLIDALTGRHKWSQKYDGRMKDFLHMLDEITKRVCTELNVQLGVGEDIRFWHKGTDNFEAWECAIRAQLHSSRLTREDLMMANELSERAISIDPEYSYAWASLGRKHWFDARYGWGESRTESMKKCVEYTDKALSLDESNYLAYITRGNLYMMQKKFDMAIVELEKAITFSPGNVHAHRELSSAMRYACRPEEAILHGKKALRLAPHAEWWVYSAIGWPYY
jgi:adenylate cyclase